jgi:hypothetical protein
MKHIRATPGPAAATGSKGGTPSPHEELPTRAQPILILTSSTGAGHDSVAGALCEAVQTLAPEATVRILDPLSRNSGLLSAGRWYDAVVSHAPWLWGLAYHLSNSEWAVRLGMAAGTLLWQRRLRTVLETARPGLVVSVHPLCTRLAAGCLRMLPDPPPLHCVVSDLVTVHRCWADDRVALFYCADTRCTGYTAHYGHPC